MHYTLHQLKVFLKIYELKSITKAADELFLTQPAVSIQLKKLQDQFEIPLTEVIGRQLYITDFGEKIAETCRKIIDEADKIKNTIDEYNGLLSGKINISIVSTAKYVLPYFLNVFLRKHPGVVLNIDVTNKSKVLESLRNNKSDFSLVSVLPDDIPLETIELMQNKLFLVASTEYSQLEKGLSDKIDIGEIGDHNLIFREEGSATRLAMENYLKSNGVKSTRKMELVSNEAVKQAVLAGLGYSIMPIIGLRNELKNGSVQIIEAEGLPITTSWNLVHNKGKNLSPAAQALSDHITETKAEVIEKYFSWVD